MSLEVRLWPNRFERRLAVGLLRLPRLNALVNSQRACSFMLSRILKFRKIPRSTFLRPGPVIRFLAEVPSVPIGFTTNADVLNHIAVAAARERLGSRNGLPTTFARSLFVPSRLLSLPLVTVK